jgi:hypothetical protein
MHFQDEKFTESSKERKIALRYSKNSLLNGAAFKKWQPKQLIEMLWSV